MIILKETIQSQEFNIIPRDYTANRMVISSIEGETSYDITTATVGRYMQFHSVVALNETKWYLLTVYNGTDIVYNGRIYCTNQELDSFSINNNEYIETVSDNNVIMV